MPTNFISTLPRMGLYCVWIPTGNLRQPLACIWIDPEVRSYGLEYFQQASSGCVENSQPRNKPETCRDRKHKSSRRFEAFNAFNRAQFYPNQSVDGDINDATFGDVLKAALARIGQVALKFNF